MTHAWAEDESGGQIPLAGIMTRDPDGTPVIVLQRETFDVSRETSQEG